MKTINNLLEKLETFKSQILIFEKNYNDTGFFDVMQEFHETIHGFNDIHLYQAFCCLSEFNEYKSFFKKKYNYYMRSIETIEALDTIQTQKYTPTAKRLRAKKDTFESIDMRSCTSYIMIESGAMPDTLIHIHDTYPILKKLVGIDTNQESTFIGSRVLRELDYQGIVLASTDVYTYNYAWYDIIHIAGFVNNKDSLLAQIAKTSQPKFIIVNQPLQLLNLVYDNISSNILNSYTSVQQKNDTFGSLILQPYHI